MNSYILAINMQHGGGAEKQIDLLLSSGEFKKLIMLESQCEYDISPSDIITLSQHTNKTNPIYKLLCCPVYAYRLYKILKIENDIVIFSVLERANYVNCITKIFLNHKALVNVQVDIFSHYKTGIKKLNFLIMKLLYKRADIVSANSQLSLIDVSEYCGVIESKQLFIPNFYDTKKLRKLSEQKLSTNEEALFQRKVIIGTGRLSEQKCPGRIIRIFRRVLVSDNDAKLVLLNDGILRDKTIEFSKSLGLRPTQSFHLTNLI